MKKKFKIPIGRLFEFFGLLDNEYNYEIPIKINRYLAIKDQYGVFKKINHLIKKQGRVNTYFLNDNLKIKCDEKHFIRENNNFVYIKNASSVDTIYGNKKIIKIMSDKIKDVYDISIDYPHEYITAQGIICHNTTLTKILVNKMDCDDLYINASDESGVDIVRTKIKPFAASVSLSSSSIKVVILDECLDENTIVWVLRNGEETGISIKNVDEKSDLVKSYNIKTNQIEWRPFYLWDVGEKDVYEIELENGEKIICTDTHKWYVEDNSENPKVVKTSELEKYNYIFSPETD